MALSIAYFFVDLSITVVVDAIADFSFGEDFTDAGTVIFRAIRCGFTLLVASLASTNSFCSRWAAVAGLGHAIDDTIAVVIQAVASLSCGADGTIAF